MFFDVCWAQVLVLMVDLSPSRVRCASSHRLTKAWAFGDGHTGIVSIKVDCGFVQMLTKRA